jgi:hypothetical protein
MGAVISELNIKLYIWYDFFALGAVRYYFLDTAEFIKSGGFNSLPQVRTYNGHKN